MQEIEYWSISSEILSNEAQKLGLVCEVIDESANIFYISSKTKKVLFKNTDFGANSALGFKLVQDKSYCYKILDLHSFPISKSFYLSKSEYNNFDTQIIKDLNFPLVIKPISEAHGNGVRMNIMTQTELLEKLGEAYIEYDNMIIQEQADGDEVRIIVMDNEVLIAYIRRPPFIIGDGKKTIYELIQIENKSNVLRGDMYESPLTDIIVDDEVRDILLKQGYTKDSILSDGKKVYLRKNSNIGTGGTLEEVTHLLAKETKQMALDISHIFGLKFAGVDIILRDITQPLDVSNGIILEINATPGLGGHKEVLGVNTAQKILKKLFGI